jgi:phospholipase C
VPVAVISPFSKQHFVSHVVHDHSSILRFIETRFGLPSLTQRDASADPMLEMFNFQNPAFVQPPTLPAAIVDQSRLCQGGPAD